MTDDQGDKAASKPTTPSGAIDWWARAIAIFGLVVSVIVGFKSEIQATVAPKSVEVEIQDVPQIQLRHGFLTLVFHTTIRTESLTEIEVSGAEIQIKSADGTKDILLKATSRQQQDGNQFLVPFRTLSIQAGKPGAYFLVFEDLIPDDKLTLFSSLDQRINKAIYDQQNPSYTLPDPEVSNKPKSKPSSSGYGGGVVYSRIQLQETTVWTAPESLRNEAKKEFDSNFKLKPGTYTLTLSVFGKSRAQLATNVYSLTILESQIAALRESAQVYTGYRYRGPTPPVPDPGIRIRAMPDRQAISRGDTFK